MSEIQGTQKNGVYIYNVPSSLLFHLGVFDLFFSLDSAFDLCLFQSMEGDLLIW